MKMNTKDRINLVTFIILLFVGPVYCYFKLRFAGDAMVLPDQMSEPTNWLDLVLGLSLAFIIVYIPDFFATLLRNYYPGRQDNFKRYLATLIFIIMFITAVIYSYMLLGEAIYKVQVPVGVFFDFFLICQIIPIFTTSLIESNYLSAQWEKEKTKRELLEKAHLQAQFEVLKSQINPHFLFNSFNTLAELINTNQKLATTFVQKLSNIYRFVLENRTNEIVEFKDELKLFKSYLFLMQIRFGDNLHIHWNIPDDKKSFGIVPMTSQMLLENAIKHNIISKEKPLNISVELDGKNTLVFKNDLQRKIDQSSRSTKTGLQNIMSRYQYVANQKIEVIENGKEFIVKVPLIKIEQL